jgi:Uma2 family endonuclease
VAVTADIRLEEVHRYSLDAYHRLIELGAFDEDEHVELLEGMLVRMSPKSPRHERAVRWLNRWLVYGVDDATHEVGVGCPLTLVESGSEPEPDFIVFERGTPSPYHPATAALAIEVAVSSLRRDLNVKAPIYAAAGVLEYWVVDLDGGRVVVHRDPRPDGYGHRHELSGGDRLAASSVALPQLDVGELLRAAGG